MQLTLAYIVQGIYHYENAPEWLLEMNKNLILDSVGHGGNGCINLRLDDVLTSQERRDIFLRLLGFVEEYLSAKGSTTETSELNEYAQDTVLHIYDIQWGGEVQTSRILKVINFLRELVIGKLQLTVSDPVDYFF